MIITGYAVNCGCRLEASRANWTIHKCWCWRIKRPLPIFSSAHCIISDCGMHKHRFLGNCCLFSAGMALVYVKRVKTISTIKKFMLAKYSFDKIFNSGLKDIKMHQKQFFFVYSNDKVVNLYILLAMYKFVYLISLR